MFAHQNARITRLFSKFCQVEFQRARGYASPMHYNFCRIHQTFGVTPVIEADVTDHIWGLEEIIALLEPSAV
jgi:hypothetical protein